MSAYKPLPGTTIDNACAEAVRIAGRERSSVEFRFNDVELVARPGDDPKEIAASYARALEAERAKWLASPEGIAYRREEKEREEARAKRTPVREESGTHKAWYAEAKKVRTVEDLSAFVARLRDGYAHDYGTICHAVAAAAVAAAFCVEHGPEGGITGFQSQAVFWEFERAWGAFSSDGPKRLVSYEDLLFPQYDHNFTEISKDTAKWLRNEAKRRLKDERSAHPDVARRWREVADGILPGFVAVAESSD